MSRAFNDPNVSGLSRRSFLTGIATLAVAGASTAFLSACGGSQPAASSEDAADQNKVLVAYYSAQGHTEKMAKAIADELGADIFVIEPANAYSEEDLDYNDEDSRVVQEYEDESVRDLTLAKNAPDNWADYDTVLVGYPIWWMDAAWAMWNFASENDFTGKTVIRFCTSYSSDIGESGQTLADLAGTGDWQEGERFDQDDDPDVATEWAQTLNI